MGVLLFDVRPRQTSNSFADYLAGNAIEDSKLKVRRTTGIEQSGITNFVVREFSCALSDAMRHTSLLSGVFHVRSVRSERQMGGIHARRVVAKMENVKSTRAFPVGKLIRKAVGKNTPIIKSRITIPFIIARSKPQPAGLSFLNLCPELLNRIELASVGTKAGAVACTSAPYFVRLAGKYIATLSAVACYLRASHDVSLLNRFRDWLGSFTASISARAVSILPHNRIVEA